MTGKTRKKESIYCIGETLLDIIFRDGQVIASKPGGAMLNTAVSLGLSGLPVELLTDFGQDAVGDLISQFLHDSGVSTTYSSRYRDGKTALALAMLDEQQNASYSFYKDFPSERLNIPFPELRKEDLLIFGSFYALTSGIRDKLKSFILSARQQGTMILYDPNFRTPHLGELPALKPLILENIAMADLIRGSDEDFQNIFGSNNGKEAYMQVKKAGCECMIYTRATSVEIFYPGNHMVSRNEVIQPVSTIGAGDAFNAGLLFYLFTKKISKSKLSLMDKPQWKSMTEMGISFAKDVCLSYDNYISKAFIEKLST